jgi:hypothetical protein
MKKQNSTRNCRITKEKTKQKLMYNFLKKPQPLIYGHLNIQGQIFKIYLMIWNMKRCIYSLTSQLIQHLLILVMKNETYTGK